MDFGTLNGWRNTRRRADAAARTLRGGQRLTLVGVYRWGLPGRGGRSVRTRWLLAALLAPLVGPACASAGAQVLPARPTAVAARPAPLTPAPGVPGNAERGHQLLEAKGGGGCHTPPSVPGAGGVAGPNLANVTLRPTLAGETLPMSPDSLTRWLLAPPALKP